MKAKHRLKGLHELSIPERYKREKERLKRSNAVNRDGDIVADDFLDKDWFKQLQMEILSEIKRLKTCTIRQLAGRFEMVDRYHLISAIDALGHRLNRSGATFTVYSINVDYKPLTPKEAESWRAWSLHNPNKAKNVLPDFIFEGK